MPPQAEGPPSKTSHSDMDAVAPFGLGPYPMTYLSGTGHSMPTVDRRPQTFNPGAYSTQFMNPAATAAGPLSGMGHHPHLQTNMAPFTGYYNPAAFPPHHAPFPHGCMPNTDRELTHKLALSETEPTHLTQLMAPYSNPFGQTPGVNTIPMPPPIVYGYMNMPDGSLTPSGEAGINYKHGILSRPQTTPVTTASSASPIPDTEDISTAHSISAVVSPAHASPTEQVIRKSSHEQNQQREQRQHSLSNDGKRNEMINLQKSNQIQETNQKLPQIMQEQQQQQQQQYFQQLQQQIHHRFYQRQQQYLQQQQQQQQQQHEHHAKNAKKVTNQVKGKEHHQHLRSKETCKQKQSSSLLNSQQIPLTADMNGVSSSISLMQQQHQSLPPGAMPNLSWPFPLLNPMQPTTAYANGSFNFYTEHMQPSTVQKKQQHQLQQSQITAMSSADQISEKLQSRQLLQKQDSRLSSKSSSRATSPSPRARDHFEHYQFINLDGKLHTVFLHPRTWKLVDHRLHVLDDQQHVLVSTSKKRKLARVLTDGGRLIEVFLNPGEQLLSAYLVPPNIKDSRLWFPLRPYKVLPDFSRIIMDQTRGPDLVSPFDRSIHGTENIRVALLLRLESGALAWKVSAKTFSFKLSTSVPSDMLTEVPPAGMVLSSTPSLLPDASATCKQTDFTFGGTKQHSENANSHPVHKTTNQSTFPKKIADSKTAIGVIGDDDKLPLHPSSHEDTGEERGMVQLQPMPQVVAAMVLAGVTAVRIGRSGISQPFNCKLSLLVGSGSKQKKGTARLSIQQGADVVVAVPTNAPKPELVMLVNPQGTTAALLPPSPPHIIAKARTRANPAVLVESSIHVHRLTWTTDNHFPFNVHDTGLGPFHIALRYKKSVLKEWLKQQQGGNELHGRQTLITTDTSTCSSSPSFESVSPTTSTSENLLNKSLAQDGEEHLVQDSKDREPQSKEKVSLHNGETQELQDTQQNEKETPRCMQMKVNSDPGNDATNRLHVVSLQQNNSTVLITPPTSSSEDSNTKPTTENYTNSTEISSSTSDQPESSSSSSSSSSPCSRHGETNIGNHTDETGIHSVRDSIPCENNKADQQDCPVQAPRKSDGLSSPSIQETSQGKSMHAEKKTETVFSVESDIEAKQFENGISSSTTTLACIPCPSSSIPRLNADRNGIVPASADSASEEPELFWDVVLPNTTFSLTPVERVRERCKRRHTSAPVSHMQPAKQIKTEWL
eukprot:gene3373-8278_t